MLRRRTFLAGSLALGASGIMSNQSGANPRPAWRVPAEEDPHELTFMQWPVSPQVYDDSEFLTDVQRTIAKIAAAISDFEPVIMLASGDAHGRARKMLSASVELWDIATEDLWCRDSGPLFARMDTGDLAVSHLQFNGWGGKQVHRHDQAIAAQVAARLELPVMASGLVGEAGGVEQDGHGLLMAHESSWVNENRNPGQSRDQIEQRLLAAYGADHLIWAPGVWGQDITDYHIDSLARFTGPGQALINLPQRPDPHDPFHQAGLDTRDQLLAAGVQVKEIAEPDYRRVTSPEFVASYANYYVCNGAVMMAAFGDQNSDAAAVEALQSFYPGREIVALNVDLLGELGGGIHCATQQLPA